VEATNLRSDLSLLPLHKNFNTTWGGLFIRKATNKRGEKMKKVIVVLFTGIVLMLLVLVFSQPVMAGKDANVWNVPGDFATIQEAIDSPEVKSGDTIWVGPGNFAGANVDKGVHIKSEGKTVIVSGPSAGDYGEFGFYLVAGSDGASFSHLTFEVGLGIYARPASDVTVEYCRFNDNFQAITNWGGSNWQIHNNTITNVITIGIDNGIGGTPIVIGGRKGAIKAQDNVVSDNKITGKVLFHDDDDGTEGNIFGIALVANPFAKKVSGNQVTGNEVSLFSNKPELRQVVALGLEDWRPPGSSPGSCKVIFGNTITLNDFHRPDIKIDTNPEELADCNYISENK
jgi:hypothetical protein